MKLYENKEQEKKALKAYKKLEKAETRRLNKIGEELDRYYVTPSDENF